MARILLTNFHPIGGGGHVPYLQALTKLNTDGEYTVGVATPKGSRLYQLLAAQNYPHLYACDFPAKLQRELPSIIRNRRLFKDIAQDFRPDIVHCSGSPDLSIAAWADPFGKAYKLVRTHHAIKKIPNTRYHRWLYQSRVSRNIYVSRSAMTLSTAQALLPQDVSVIANGVDLDFFQPIQKDHPLAMQFGIEDDTFCFGSCAGLGSYKRVDSIIQAAQQLQGERKFKIIAIGDQNSGEKLEKLARELGVNQFIYGGFHHDVRPLVSLFDVGFILSDAIETISFAAREMMAMGKPLLSSSFSGLKENVIDGSNGFLVPPGGIDQIADRMRHYLRMSATDYKLFSARAREHAEREFNITDQLSKHRDIYAELTR